MCNASIISLLAQLDQAVPQPRSAAYEQAFTALRTTILSRSTGRLAQRHTYLAVPRDGSAPLSFGSLADVARFARLAPATVRSYLSAHKGKFPITLDDMVYSVERPDWKPGKGRPKKPSSLA